jgi:Protein of unknown function (DUF4230)
MASQSDDRSRTTEVLPAQREETIVYVPREESGRWGRRLLALVGTFGVLVALFFGLKSVDLLPDFRNPFATQTTDRTGPVLLQSIVDLKQYTAAEGNFQVIVDYEESKRFVPSPIFGERTLFVGVGRVDAYVDFSGLTEGAITQSADRRSIEIKLPPPVLKEPVIDMNNSRVVDQDRGLFNRVGDFFSNDPNKTQQMNQLAQQKIAEAAQQSGLTQRAEINTRAMLEGLFRSLGYEEVTVTFTKP